MSKTTTAPAAPKFMGRDVMSVYSGRPGCACGCRGKHTYHPATREMGTKNRGYEVTDEDVSERGMAIILKKMEEFKSDEANFDVEPTYAAYETATRLYVVYFAPK